jgi:hypothetical protein
MLEIKDLDINIPINEVIHIKQFFLPHNTKETLQQQALHTLHTILQQNYFQYSNMFYQPTKGVDMDSPISGLIAESFLQFFEKLSIKLWRVAANTLNKHLQTANKGWFSSLGG